MIPLVWLHEIDDTPDAARHKRSHFFFHHILSLVSRIIARQELAGIDPVAAGERRSIQGASHSKSAFLIFLEYERSSNHASEGEESKVLPCGPRSCCHGCACP